MTIVSTRSFYVDQVQDVTVVCFTVSSIIDSTYEFVSDELFEFVEYVTSNGPIQVVLDLSSVRQIDDWGLAMLRAFHETIESNAGTVILCRIPQNVSDALNDVGLGRWFQTCKTRGEAIQSFSQA